MFVWMDGLAQPLRSASSARRRPDDLEHSWTFNVSFSWDVRFHIISHPRYSRHLREFANMINIWVAVWNMAFIFHNIYGIILPIDELIFFKTVIAPPTSNSWDSPLLYVGASAYFVPRIGGRKKNPTLHCRGKNRQKNLRPIYGDSLSSSFVVGKSLLFMVG